MLKLAKLNDRPEIYHAIQGEGKNLGVPSVFIRLSLCNLYCVWCDTDYTWNWEGTDFPHVNDAKPGYRKFKKEEQIITCPVQTIVDEVEKYQCQNIVLTGGEPFVQHKDLTELAQALKEGGHHIEVETNGTIKPPLELDAHLDQYNVSIKLANAGVAVEDRINEEAARFFARSEKSNFKFVVEGPDDATEVFDLIQHYQIPASRVFLMPEGTNARELNSKMEWLMHFCEANGFHFTDRLHIRIHGNKRGV